MNVENVVRKGEVEVLDRIGNNIMMCDITSDDNLGAMDANFVKLFRLAQLTIEYLLHTQSLLAAQSQRQSAQIQALNKVSDRSHLVIHKLG